MALDGITIANVVRDLNERLSDARISKIVQPENDALFLTFKSKTSGQTRLLMSASASLPLIYITQANRQAPITAPNFCMLLRKHIGNGKVLRVYQPSLERIIHFEIEHYDEMGDLCKKILTIELMGKHSNIIFCDDNGRIIDAIKHISSQTSSVREVLPGRDYFIPNTGEKLDPLTSEEGSFCSHVFSKPMPLAKAIYTTYTGISPVIAEEICHRSGAESDLSANCVEPLMQVHLFHSFSLLMDDVKEGRFTPSIFFDGHEKPVEFASVPLSMLNDLKAVSYDSVSEVLEQYYSMRDKVTRIRQKSSDLRRIVSTAIERTAKKLDLQEKQLRDTEKRDKYKLYGELLHTYGYGIEDGAKKAVVTNYYTGEELSIPLDETISVSENAKHFYDKYAKLKRTGDALSTLVIETRADLDQLLSIQTFLDMALGEEDLIQVKEELTDAGYIRRHGKDKKQRIVSKPYHFRTTDGYDIYVGKNNYQNDELTFRFASGGDWWFHAKGAPGSHVVVKGKGAELPDHVFEDAARLAAYFSANRASDKVEIDYIQRKHVKKPSGAKPGFVVYYTNYSMVIDTNISGLTQISD